MYRPVRWPDTPSSTPRQGRCWAMANLEGQHIRLGGWKEPLGSQGHSDTGVMKMDRQTLGPWTWRQRLRVAGSARCLVLALKWLAQATILQMETKNTSELPLSLWTKGCSWPLQGC